MLILPDGSEREISRAGRPSVLEQKKVLKLAARWGVDAVVCEMMSIKSDCLKAESHSLLRPQVLLITNVRLDHIDDMGGTKAAVAQSMATAIHAGCTVLVPEEECYPAFEEAAERAGARVLRIPPGPFPEDSAGGRAESRPEFEENRNLALAAAGFLGVDRETGRRGIEKSRPDFGSLKVWKLRLDCPSRIWYAASLFAANDPESSGRALFHLQSLDIAFPSRTIGLLNLRQDRGDRTLQWFRVLETNFFLGFQRLVFIGDHASALDRRKKWAVYPGLQVSALPDRDSRAIMAKLAAGEPGDALIVGLGNMGGLGEDLVEYWAQAGETVS